jgi:hypothetical protein
MAVRVVLEAISTLRADRGLAAGGAMLGTVADFTVAQARAELDRLQPLLAEFVTLRADAAELAAALAGGLPATAAGGVPELKGAQARLDEMVGTIRSSGVEVKGFAPLLLDFPAHLDGLPVLLCWLEGDRELTWYHRLDLGFAGRRLLDGSPGSPGRD